MIKINKSCFRLLSISLLSWSIYYFLNYSEKVNYIVLEIQESTSSRAFGLYIVFHIAKWFVLVFGIVSLLMFLKIIFKRNTN